MAEERLFRLDPRKMISDPFVECPSCGRVEFGVLSVGGDGYSRRCRNCLHEAGYDLPPIRKRVLLLDQFAVSNLMFTLDSRTPGHTRVLPEYKELFDLLDTLVKLQVIVCPTSPTHYEESVVSGHYDGLKRIAEHLGNGCSFWEASEVRRFQLTVHCWNWLQGRAEEEPTFDEGQFVYGKLHEWSDTLLLTVDRSVTTEDIEAIRRQRNGMGGDLRALFARWQTESLSFDQRLKHELDSFGLVTLRRHARFYADLEARTRELQQLAPEALFPPTSVTLVNMMCLYLREKGMSPSDAFDAVSRYFLSDALRFVPCLRISCMLWAAVARKASSGQKRPPTQGMVNDVDVAAAILPYVDAAFLDNEVRAFLSEEPLKSKSGITARLFSTNNIKEFLEYLRTMIASTPKDHLKLARTVYGDDGLQPYREMLDDERARRGEVNTTPPRAES